MPKSDDSTDELIVGVAVEFMSKQHAIESVTKISLKLYRQADEVEEPSLLTIP